MAHTITVPEHYGYTVLLALGIIPVLSFTQGNLVVMRRAAAGVPYPNHYATPQQCKESREAYAFNCAQRAHGNLLENIPVVIPSLLFAGLSAPTITPVLGVGWLFCRILFTWGYMTDKQGNKGKGRLVGAGFWLFQAGIWGIALWGALKML